MAAFSARVRGLDIGPYRHLERGTRAQLGEQLLLLAWEYMGEHSFYNGTACLYTMDRAATENCLRVTHDAYRDALLPHLAPGFLRMRTGWRGA